MKMQGRRVPLLGTSRKVSVRKEAESFYKSKPFLAWRAEVLRRAGHRCQHPGCGVSKGRLFADHIVERKDGGDPLDPNNGQCLCAKHHNQKTAVERAKRLR